MRYTRKLVGVWIIIWSEKKNRLKLVQNLIFFFFISTYNVPCFQYPIAIHLYRPHVLIQSMPSHLFIYDTCQLFSGRPCKSELLPPGFHCKICFFNLSFGILRTCSNHINYIYKISLILSFVVLSILHLPDDFLQKAISVAFNFFPFRFNEPYFWAIDYYILDNGIVAYIQYTLHYGVQYS